LYHYRAKLDRVVDGDTIDVSIDLGFDVWLHKQRLRLNGIDTPESRTRNKAEKVLGLAAKERLTELCSNELSLVSHGKGKYGRILATVYTGKTDICKKLIKEGHAVEYYGGTKLAKVRADGTWGIENG
tara:strand:+ start:252 stop:635 length:384 start_codon:yes stop_codon:yes gene_type:complete